MRIRDANQIAASVLQQATLTTPRPGETAGERASRAGALWGVVRALRAISPEQREANGLMGAIARWGTIKEIIPPMPASRKNLDMNQLAKRILDEATGDEPKTEPPPPKDQRAVESGTKGGIKGGPARAAKLAPEQRAEIAKRAAAGRWKKS